MNNIAAAIRSAITPKSSIIAGMVSLWVFLFVSSAGRHGDQSLALFTTTGLSLAFGVLALLVLPSGIRATLPYPLIIAAFYFTVTLRPFSMFLLYQNPDNPFLGSPQEYVSAVWIGVLAQGTLFAFLVCVRRRIAFVPRHRVSAGTSERCVRWRTLFRHLALALLVLIPLLNILTMRLNIGFMGGPDSTLPFRLGGIIVVFRALTLTLALFLVQCAFRTNRRLLQFLSIGILALDVIWVVIATSSRGTIVGSTLMVMFLYILMASRINYRKLVVGFLVLLVIAMITFPYITAYRNAGRLDADAILQSYRRSYTENAEFDQFEMFYQLLNRYTGMETLVPILRSADAPIGVQQVIRIISGHDQYVSIGDYYQRHFLGFSGQFGSGFLGELFVIGGSIGVILGTFSLLTAFFVFWRSLLRSSLITAPVIGAYAASAAIELPSGGDILLFIFSSKGIIVPVAFFVILEWIVRWYRIRRRVHGVRYQHQRAGMVSLRASV